MLADFLGHWTGLSRLYLEGATGPFDESASTLTAVRGVHERFVEVHYTWSYQGKPQTGSAILCVDGAQASAAWCDSFHLNNAIMYCTGSPVNVKGSYTVPGYPEWHWRIIFAREGEQLKLTMYNISPEGEEFLAVQADYAPAA